MIYIVMLSWPFIITDDGLWYVGPDASDSRGWITSKKSDLTTPPRSGWWYSGDTDWVLDDTLLFMPGGPEKEL